MTAEELTEKIVKYVAEHAHSESVFLSPDPQWNVNAEGLLDFLNEITGISKEQISEWVKSVFYDTNSDYLRPDVLPPLR